MKQSFRFFVLGLFICLLPLVSNGQMGNDNPTSVTGEFSGSITTGGHYDPYTGNAKRVIEDIVVPASIGAYPLKWTRILNTRSGWTNSYNWGLYIRPPQPPIGGENQYEGPAGTVSYPDGRHIDLWDDGVSEWRIYDAEGPVGMINKLIDRGGGYYDLLLGDGGKVVFGPPPPNLAFGSAWAQAIVDPYGQITTLDRDASGKLTRVTEPGGRYLQINYIDPSTPPPYAAVGSVQAFDGRGNLIETVSYGYTQVWVSGLCHYNLTHVYYDDGTQGVYTYELSNLHNSPNPGYSATPDVVHSCDDVRYAGPMKQIEYEYVQWGGADPGYVAWGQVKSERNFNTHQIVSQVSHPTSPYDPALDQRIETRGDGATRVFSYGLPGMVDHYTDFKNQTTYPYQFTDARGNTTTTEYEPVLHAVKKITHPDLSTIEFTFCDPNNPYYISGRKDERNNWTYYDRDANHRVWQTRYPDGAYETFSYNPFGQVSTHRLTSGGTESFTYDYRGLKTSSTDPLGNVTTYNYLWNDRLQNVVDPYGNATWYDYNQRGQVTKVTHQDGTYTQSGYNPDSTLAWTADENHPNASLAGHENERTRYTYDEYKRVLTVTNAMGETTTNYYGLDWANPLVHTTNCVKYTLSPLGENVVYEYDANFRKTYQGVALGTADAVESRFDYDEVGNLTWTRDPRFNVTTFGYDARNRKSWMNDPIASDRNSSHGHTMDWEYDAVGNKTKETRADDAFQTWNYDSMNRLVEHYGFAGERVVRYDRNTEHTWEWITDAKGATYAISFDALHRKVHQHYPADATRADPGEHFWYDAVGNLIQYKNPADQYQHFHYDSRNRRDHSWWDGSAGQDIVTSYDPASRVTNIQTNGGETIVAFGHDDANRQIWEEQTLAGYPTHRIQTARDADGNRSSLWVYTNGQGPYGIFYDYTQRNQLAHIYDGGWNPWFNYAYDAAGNMTKRQDVYWGVNDSEDCHPGNYDPLNRPVEWENTGATDNPFARNWYQYDRVGREVATWRDEQGGKGERFEYDPTNQLKKVSYDAQSVWTGTPQSPMKTQDYVYTPDRLNRSSMTENGVVTSYAANAMNQYTVNGTTYNYDGNFNLREAPNWGGDFDAQNHLMSAGHGGNVVFFTYDGLGRCVRRQVFVPSGASTTVLYTYDGWKPTMEWDGAGNLAAWNIYGAGADEILWRYTVDHGHLRYHHDRHGNVTFLLGPGGEALERYSYDAFGRPRIMDWAENERSESAVGNRFMFQGREWIPELGIYDYRHRMYQPGLGRFLQADPTGFDAGDMNLFRYCGDDPVDGSDPSGLAEASASSNFWRNLTNFYNGNPSMDVVLDAWNQQPPHDHHAMGEGGRAIDEKSEGSKSFLTKLREFVKSHEYEIQTAAEMSTPAGRGAGLFRGLVARLFGKNAPAMTSHVIKQMTARGWTEKTVQQAFRSGKQIPAINKATGNAATRYIHPTTGQSMVVDNVTNEVIHIGGPGFQYGPTSGDLPH